MKKIASLAVTCTLLFSLAAPASAQQPGSTPTPSPSQQQTAPRDDDEDVVRITTNLVQVDAVIVDKSGRQVTDLSAEDFEILEDNRAQKITNFSYVSNETAPRPAAAEPSLAVGRKPTDKLAPPEPPRRLRPEQVRRTMALVVDDLGLSFESVSFVREALRKFVDEQMQPHDLVAIVRTSAGVGALQQFTSDKRQLHAAIDRVKWYLNGRGGVSAFAAVESNPLLNANARSGDDERRAAEARTTADINTELGDFREEIFAVGTLGALNFVVRGMRELPGRKSVTLLSDGFSIQPSERGPSSERVLQALRQLTDLANRASVVVYTIDARGLVAPGFRAEDDTSGLSLEQFDAVQRNRAFQMFDSQSGMDYLSRQTGGFLIKNSNDLARGIKRVVEDQKGYYLIGYRPESATFDRRYHRITVKVKRSGLKVRTRTGFYGIRDEETRPVRRTREEQLLGALTSPFASAGVRLRLTTIFGNYTQGGSFLRSLMHFDARDLKFAKEPDGAYKAVIDVLGVTFGDNGRVIDSRDQTGTLKMNEETYRAALRDGVVYSFDVPVKKAGVYQLRMAVRDTATERTGSASQFVEVPDLKKDRLTLSGVVVSGMGENDQANATRSTVATTGAQADGQVAEGAASETRAHGSPAVRRFRPKSTLAFGYVIYNARLDKATSRPQLTAQTRIFRDGQPVYTGNATPLGLAQPVDLNRIPLSGRLQLGSNLTPGEYVLQVVVTDALAKEKYRTATQWIDFEIVK